MTVKQQVLDFLMDPNIAFILLVVGALAIYVEFHTPGAVIPGTVGFIAVLLAIFALHLLPTSWAGITLILGAFILFALEAKFQSHGVLTLGATALLVLGALMLVDGPIPQMRIRLWTALAVSIPFAAITSLLMTVAIRARRNKVQTGKEELIGQIATVNAPLAPEGTVFVLGETWNAVSAKPASVGDKVRVRAVNGLRLEVEPLGEKS
jgi:membrane-bound serine protease (ClpP class)